MVQIQQQLLASQQAQQYMTATMQQNRAPLRMQMTMQQMPMLMPMT